MVAFTIALGIGGLIGLAIGLKDRRDAYVKAETELYDSINETIDSVTEGLRDQTAWFIHTNVPGFPEEESRAIFGKGLGLTLKDFLEEADINSPDFIENLFDRYDLDISGKPKNTPFGEEYKLFRYERPSGGNLLVARKVHDKPSLFGFNLEEMEAGGMVNVILFKPKYARKLETIERKIPMKVHQIDITFNSDLELSVTESETSEYQDLLLNGERLGTNFEVIEKYPDLVCYIP